MGSVATALPDIQSPEAARAGVRAFFRLAELWGLTRSEMATLLGVRSTSTLDNWRKKAPETLQPDTLERISYLLHIHRSLRQILPAERADEWPRRPNSAAPFLGRSALEFMLQGRVQHLLDVHRYLQGVASGAF
jgi:transcriptional regulator with XRE-family HTH domain